MQIRTTKLQEMMAKAIKGVGNNKQIPLTSLLSLEVKEGKLTIITTDATNYLYMQDTLDGSDEDFYVVVQADLFAKLIARMTSDTITLTIVNGNLEVKGNGTYTIPVILDDDTGEMLKYPDPAHAKNFDKEIGELSVDNVKTILTALKPALATTSEMPQYKNYYVGDGVMATDTFKIGYLPISVFETPRLLSAELVDLLDVMTDTIKVMTNGEDRLLFVTDNALVYGPAMYGIENYQVDAIKAYINRDYPSKCKVSKVALLQLIDRLSLFVNEVVDDGVVQIVFTQDGLQVLSNLSSGVETVPYIACDSLEDSVDGSIYLEMLRSQVKAQTGDSAEIWFGDEKSIKLTDENNGVVAVCGLVQ